MNRVLLKVVLLLLLSAALWACGAAVSSMTNAELLQRLQGPQEMLVVLDVRSAREYAAGHVPSAINIPHDQLAARVGELKSRDNAEFVVYCEAGVRAGKAESILQSEGFIQVTHLQGDMRQWRKDGLPTEK